MKTMGLLLVLSLLAWAALLYPGWLWWGDIALVHSATAWGLCVIPGAIATAWAVGRSVTPEMRTLVILGGSGVRMFATLCGGLILTEMYPATFTNVFWLWVGVFYMLLLGLEVVLLLRHHQRSAPA